MAVNQFLHFPPPPAGFNSLNEVAQYLRRLWDALKAMRRGKLECVIEVTLTANTTTTTINDIRLSSQSVVLFDPKTANAAAELYGGTMYVLNANRTTGVWVITHANNVQTDRTFQTCIIG